MAGCELTSVMVRLLLLLLRVSCAGVAVCDLRGRVEEEQEEEHVRGQLRLAPSPPLPRRPNCPTRASRLLLHSAEGDVD